MKFSIAAIVLSLCQFGSEGRSMNNSLKRPFSSAALLNFDFDSAASEPQGSCPPEGRIGQSTIFYTLSESQECWSYTSPKNNAGDKYPNAVTDENYVCFYKAIVPPGVQPTLTVNPFHLQKVNGNGACSRDWFQVNGIGNHGEDKDRNSTNNMVRFCDQIVNPIVLENLVPDAHNIVEMQFKVNSNNGEAGFTFNLCLPDDDPPWPRDK